MFEETRNGWRDEITEYTELKQRLDGCACNLAHILEASNRSQPDREKMQRCEQQFQNMCDGRDEVFWFSLFSPTSLLRVSYSFERVWGYQIEKLYHNPRLWVNAIHPDDRQRVERAFASWIEQRSRVGYSIKYRIVRSDKSVSWLCDNVSGLFDQDGALFGTSGVVRTIAEGVQTEACDIVGKFESFALRRDSNWLAV